MKETKEQLKTIEISVKENERFDGCCNALWEGSEGVREGGREGGRVEGREGRRGRESGREGRRGRESGRKEGREREKLSFTVAQNCHWRTLYLARDRIFQRQRQT